MIYLLTFVLSEFDNNFFIEFFFNDYFLLEPFYMNESEPQNTLVVGNILSIFLRQCFGYNNCLNKVALTIE